MDIEYSDGLEIENQIFSLIRGAGDRSACASVASDRYSIWPVRYHLCPERANLLRPFDFAGLDVLELGAGMGAVSRFLAEQARSLYVVEGTQARFRVLSERLCDLKNWEGEVGNFQDFHTDRRFDVVCLVGVLEYCELFLKTPGESPHLWLLRRCQRFLKPGGVLVLAIENALGLKYWNGAAEDHRATLFDGVCGYPDTPTPRTFSRKELLGLLQVAGYPQVDTFYPYPDYKVPTTVVSDPLIERAPRLAAELSGLEPYRDYLGLPLVKYFSDTLALDHLSRAGLLGEFSNSFLFVAGTGADSCVRASLLAGYLDRNELAWHYGHARRDPIETRFSWDPRRQAVLVDKRGLYHSQQEKTYGVEGLGKLHWTALGPQPVSAGVPVRLLLARHAYFQQWSLFHSLFKTFLTASIGKWIQPGGSLDGAAIDGIFVNAHAVATLPDSGPSDFVFFDQEWRLDSPIPQSWFIFRNVFNLVREEALIHQSAPFASLEDFYLKLCAQLGVAADFDGDLVREAQLQQATSHGTFEKHHAQLRGLFQRRLPPSVMPRDPAAQGRVPQGGNRPIRKLAGALKRRFLRVLNHFPQGKRRLKGYQLRAKALLSFLKTLRDYWSIALPQLLPSSGHAGFSTGRVAYFPQGYFFLKVKSLVTPVEVSIRLQMHGRFVVQTVPLIGGEQICRLAVPAESLTVKLVCSPTLAPTLRARRISRWEAGLRLLLSGRGRWCGGVRMIWDLPVVDSYGAWVEHSNATRVESRKQITARIERLDLKPLFSVVMPVYNTDEKWLRKAIESVRGQIYAHWELCIADDASTEPHIAKVLKEYSEIDPRVRVVWRGLNGHICAASNSALAIARGEFIALLDHDDELAPQALALVAESLNAHPDADLLYSDEDKISLFGRRYHPSYKSEFDPELFYSKNYVSHLGVFRAALVKSIGGFRPGTEGSQDYDLVLRVLEHTTSDRVVHIPEILYHWRAIPGSVALSEGEKPYAHGRARKAIEAHLHRRGVQAEVGPGFGYMHRVHYPRPAPLPFVSVIIPTRDHLKLLKTIVKGVLARTDYPGVEILIVDNQSTDRNTLAYLLGLRSDPRVRVLRYDATFNFSAMINLAAREAKYPLLAILNNDLRVKHADWLTEMVRHAVRPEVGCVGAKLVYPDGTLQHAGLVLGINGIADHVFKHFPADSNAMAGRLQLAQSVSAVTAACLVVRKQVFEAAGGFDEKNLPVAYNDVDFCLRVRGLGLRNIWTPYAELVHLESASRGSDAQGTNLQRFREEVKWMQQRWGSALLRDPYHTARASPAAING